jgi:hypothetical protein
MSDDTTMTTTPAPAASTTIQHVDPAIFTSLQSKIDEESSIRDELKTYVETLSKQGRLTSSILSRIHNTPSAELERAVLNPAYDALAQQASTVKDLAQSASRYPFYKWNTIWQRDIQAVISSMQMLDWLQTGKLVTIEDVGQRLGGTQTLLPPSLFLSLSHTHTFSREECELNELN